MHKETYEIKEFHLNEEPSRAFHRLSRANAALLAPLQVFERKEWLGAELKRNRNAAKRARKARRVGR